MTASDAKSAFQDTAVTNDEKEFWRLVIRKGLPRWKIFRRPIAVSELDHYCWGQQKYAWQQLKDKIGPEDQIWPFALNVRSYLGFRKGFVVVRKGQPIGGIITEVS